MTASAKIRGADKIVVNFGDKMLVLDAEEAIALHADLSRILGDTSKLAEVDEVLGKISRACDALSSEAMKLQRGLR